jgi:nicotinate-nucleotide adenylyltransferase
VRIGLYGGSFDPVHLGHLLVAQAAREEAGLDRVLFVPAAQSPFKPERKLSPGHLRAQMLRLALAGRSYCEVDLQELDRGGISYTIETVQNCRTRFPSAQLAYVIGADHVPLLPKWRAASELGALMEFLVIPRPGQPEIPFPTGFKGRYLKGFSIAVSASQIRDRIKNGLAIDLLVGPDVAEVISHNDLYLS